MPIIQEFAQAIVEKYDYSQSAWVTVNTLDDDKIISAGIRKQCCPDGAITIGGVYAALLNITCRMPGMSYFQVRSSRITMKHKYAGELDYTQLGVFYVTDCNRIAGDLFQITAQDAVGWTDTSSLNGTGSEPTEEETKCCVGAFMYAIQQQDRNRQIDETCERLTGVTNRFIQAQSGIPSLLEWELYDASRNGNYNYANAMTYDNAGNPLNPAYFGLYARDGNINNLEPRAWADKPRDYYRFLAELAAGFVHARENGKLALGQFGQIEYGVAQLSNSDIEFGTLEIADYDIQYLRATATAESTSWISQWVYNDHPNYAEHSYIRLTVENNPFLDGFLALWNEGTISIARGIWYPLSKYGGGFTIRPFHCTVHNPIRFHLGQRVLFTDTNQASIITSIQWTFRGGWKIACGGEDGRTMTDCLRVSKGDRVARDLMNNVTSLKGR